MQIRRAVESDIGAIVEMGRHFLGSSRYADFLIDNPAVMTAFALALLDRDDAAIFVATEGESLAGVIIVTVADHAFSGQRIATELVWWVEPAFRGVGLKLLAIARKWSKVQGAVALQLGAPSPEVVRLYERLGYREIERIYQVALT